jgi:hypothetical protein
MITKCGQKIMTAGPYSEYQQTSCHQMTVPIICMSVRTTLFAEDKFVISKEEGSVQCHTGEVEDIVDSVQPRCHAVDWRCKCSNFILSPQHFRLVDTAPDISYG